MTEQPKRMLILTLVLMTSLLLAACGGGATPTNTAPPPTVTATAPEITPEATPEVTPETTPEVTPEVTEEAQAALSLAEVDQRPFLGINIRNQGSDAPVEIFVDEGGPAAVAGLQNADIITAIDGETVTTGSIAEVLAGYDPGDVIEISAQRGDEMLEIAVELGAQPAGQQVTFRSMEQPFMGLHFIFESEQTTIVDVNAGSPGASAGIEPGDLLIAIDGVAADNINVLMRDVMPRTPGQTATLEVARDDETFTVEIALAAPMGDLPGSGGASQGPPDLSVILDDVAFEDGVWVMNNIVPGGVLGRLGLENGDIITAINDQILMPEAIIQLIPTLSMEDDFVFTVERDGETLLLETDARAVVSLGAAATAISRFVPERPTTNNALPPGFTEGSFPAGMPQSGMGIVPFTIRTPLDLLNQLGLEAEPGDTGLIITEVEAESNAAAAGLQAGDEVVGINGITVSEDMQMMEVLATGTTTITLSIIRDDEPLEVEFSLRGGTSLPLPPSNFPPSAAPGSPGSSGGGSGMGSGGSPGGLPSSGPPPVITATPASS